MPVTTSPVRRPSRTSSRWTWRVAVPQPSGRRPAEIVSSFAMRSGWRTASATPTRPPRLAPANVTGDVQPMPSSHAAIRSARPSADSGGSAPSSKPRHVDPLPGQHGASTVACAGSTRSGACSAGHHGSVLVAASPNGNGDAVMPPMITTTGAVPSGGPST
jgi:hypothetical protein